MYLPQTAKYALRVMAQLLLEGEVIRARDLSRKTKVPVPFLSKVMRRLVRKGLLRVRKGPGGGFSLARPAGKIRFFDILEAADYKFEAERCLFGWKKCDGRNPCPLHPAWSEAKEDFLKWARETTLSSIS